MAKKQRTLIELLLDYKRLGDGRPPHHHSHRVPETWVDDGTPCEQCITWRELVAAAENV